MNDLHVADPYPEVLLDSLRKAYPHPRNRKAEILALRKTLDRLVQGETDGKAMSTEAAVAFLRTRLEEARQAFSLRSKAFTPHLSTFLNQRRYLRVQSAEVPENLEDAISILSCYPTVAAVDVDAHMPALRVIDEHIKYLRATHGSAAASYIRQRTIRFAECVAKWPDGESQFIPGADKFFKERRYEQPESLWVRTPKAGFESERAQLARIM
jgi:hypothetical protein